jgi:hypothetical protein
LYIVFLTFAGYFFQMIKFALRLLPLTFSYYNIFNELVFLFFSDCKDM